MLNRVNTVLPVQLYSLSSCVGFAENGVSADGHRALRFDGSCVTEQPPAAPVVCRHTQPHTKWLEITVIMQRQVVARVHSRSKDECSLAEEQEATYRLHYCITVY